MFCGTGSLKSVDDGPWSPPSSSPTKRKANKNPYSARGLDKYSAVLAELEARRAKVMEKVGSRGAAMVRFVYSNSNEWIPIIIKLSDAPQQDDADAKKKPKSPPARTTSLQSDKVLLTSGSAALHPAPAPDQLDGSSADHGKEAGEAGPGAVLRKRLEKTFSWGVRDQVKGWSWSSLRPRYYWPLVLVLMLACLVAFGRVFAICCTSIWWYLVPVMQQQGETATAMRRSAKTKKDHGIRRTFDRRPQQPQQPQQPPPAAVTATAEQPHRSRTPPKEGGRGVDGSGLQEVTSPRGRANAKRG